jgi:Flp pilus assembly pilin Flp
MLGAEVVMSTSTPPRSPSDDTARTRPDDRTCARSSFAETPRAPRAGSRRHRAATTVEYALIILALLLLAAGSYKLLGSAISKRSNAASETVTQGSGAAGESGAQAATTAKREAGFEAESRAARGAAGSGDARSSDMILGFSAKRWLGVGLLGAGIFALTYIFVSIRRAKAPSQGSPGPGPKI